MNTKFSRDFPLTYVLAAVATALPKGITVIPGGSLDTVTPLTDLSPLSKAAVLPRQAAPIPLRIMSLGASVTFGFGSTTGDSYRKNLRDQLVAAGHTVNYVGEFKNGNDFVDNDVEAQGGFTISQIAGLASTAVPQFLPNLVLLDAGTNNCNNGGLVPDAGANVSALINSIYTQSPGATIILTSILANKIPEQDACRVDINTQYSALAAQLGPTGEAAKFLMVDMRSPEAPTVNDLFDTRHPNDVGYQKMANVWFAGVQQVVASGFITAAIDNGLPADGGA